MAHSSKIDKLQHKVDHLEEKIKNIQEPCCAPSIPGKRGKLGPGWATRATW